MDDQAIAADEDSGFLIPIPSGDGQFAVRVPCEGVRWFDTRAEAEDFIADALHTPVADAEPGA